MINNEAERTIRHSVMGRKNFHGSRTQRGVETASVLYSIVESCKKVELDPKDYILMVVGNSLDKIPIKTPFEYTSELRS